MLMGVAEGGSSLAQYPELAGKRTLVTGLSSRHGIDVARAFADHGCRLVLHMAETDATGDAVLEVLAQTAADIRAYSEPLDGMDGTVRFAQTAAQAFGGLEIVVNIIALEMPSMARSAGAVEDAVAAQLRDACLVTRVTANRMRLTMAEGLVLNIVAAPLPRSAAESSVIAVARTVLAAMTRHEAAHWAGQGIRINAVAPTTGLGRPAAAGGGSLGSEPDIAALALFLASRAGRELSGLLFDAAGAAVCC